MKANNATFNRPEGDRAIDAPFIIADIEDCITKLKDENAWDKNDRNAVTLFKTQGTTVVLTCLQDEASMNDVMVDGSVILQVMQGKINVIVDGDAFELCKPQTAMIHANVTHSIYALEESSILITTNVIGK